MYGSEEEWVHLYCMFTGEGDMKCVYREGLWPRGSEGGGG